MAEKNKYEIHYWYGPPGTGKSYHLEHDIPNTQDILKYDDFYGGLPLLDQHARKKGVKHVYITSNDNLGDLITNEFKHYNKYEEQTKFIKILGNITEVKHFPTRYDSQFPRTGEILPFEEGV